MCSGVLDLVTYNFGLSDRSMMLNGAAFQSLVLAAVCLSSRAVPLINITSSGERCCDGETPSQTHLEEEDRKFRTESNTPSPESTRPSVFTPEISSERPHSSSYSSRVHDGMGSVTPRWDSSYQTADGQQDNPIPEDSSLSLKTADPFITENSESSDRPDYIQLRHSHERRREDNTSVQEEDRSDSTDVHLLTSVSLNSRALDDTDVWTEALHLQREDVSVEPSSQDLLTDATMSSEDLPLIFEPFEDVTPAGNSALVSRMSVAMAPTAVTVEDAEIMVSMDTEHTSSLSGMLDWPSSWQMLQMKATEHDGKTENDDITQMMTVTSSEVLQIPTSRSKTDTEDQESKEETDEDEEDDGMDSDEDKSEEDLTETTMTPPNRPPYSLIPPPPVWMQGNHGLIRSWVELIREKAGYVSGMLAPVGIGIAGALLLVGTLYSIRVFHHRRRENVKHQRSRPPREVRSGPDNAMLLADSSEDEF